MNINLTELVSMSLCGGCFFSSTFFVLWLISTMRHPHTEQNREIKNNIKE